MQIAEKWQLPPFKLGMRADEEAIVELRSSRLAGPRANPAQAFRWRAKARPRAQSRPLKAAPPGR